MGSDGEGLDTLPGLIRRGARKHGLARRKPTASACRDERQAIARRYRLPFLFPFETHLPKTGRLTFAAFGRPRIEPAVPRPRQRSKAAARCG